MWFGCGSDVVRTWFGCGSDVFSDLVQTVWQKLRVSGFQHPKTRNFMTWVFLQKERIFPGVHKIDASISGPRIADKNYTDTRIFLSLGSGSGGWWGWFSCGN